MKIRNVILIGCLAGLTLVIVLFLNLNKILTISIEQIFTKSLAVETIVREVAFNPLNGYLKLNGFEISNPKGFSTPKFLQIQDFIIQIKPNTLLADRIEIEKIQLKDISIDIEQQFSRNNIQEIFAVAEKHKRSQTEAAGQEKKFNLQSASIDNVSVNFNLAYGMFFSSKVASLPKVELQNLNSENYQGLLMSEVFTKLISSTLKNIIEDSKSTIPKQILDALE